MKMCDIYLFLEKFINTGVLLHTYNKYYRAGTPKVSDVEYDAMLMEWRADAKYLPQWKDEPNVYLYRAAVALSKQKLF